MRLTWRGNQVTNAVKQAILQGLRDGAEHILTESIDECPIESGTLRRSGKVTEIDEKLIISYDTPYATKQHEDMSLQHIDGKAKFLEDPFNRNQQRVLDLIRNRIRNL